MRFEENYFYTAVKRIQSMWSQECNLRKYYWLTNNMENPTIGAWYTDCIKTKYQIYISVRYKTQALTLMLSQMIINPRALLAAKNYSRWLAHKPFLRHICQLSFNRLMHWWLSLNHDSNTDAWKWFRQMLGYSLLKARLETGAYI